MKTFLIGLVLLIVGGFFYGKLCEKIFKPDDRPTPAVAQQDGVDFVPIKKWRNSLINLLNIAGTGPILGPIQGILFGPIAFILIPVGCVLGGALHDYFSGMLSIRNKGMQMPELIKKFTGKGVFGLYHVFMFLLLILVGTVFIYTPGDIAATSVFGLSGEATDVWTWVIYGAIFLYYIIATLFPIDKIIGKVYPIFGAVMILSAIGVLIGIFTTGYPLTEVSVANWKGIYPVDGTNIVPVFFITVACGICSGFHSSQTSIVARTVEHEKEGRTVFYNMMIAEGFIAMIWAAAAMGAYNLGLASIDTNATNVVGIVAKSMLGPIGGTIAIIGIIILPITSGDTALRSLRLSLSESLHIDQSKKRNRLGVSLVLFAIVAGLLIWAKTSPSGFTLLWRYFSWSNQTIAIFAFAIITIYMIREKGGAWFVMPLVPGMFYAFVTFSYICSAQIGFGLPMAVAYILGAIFAVLYGIAIIAWAKHKPKLALQTA